MTQYRVVIVGIEELGPFYAETLAEAESRAKSKLESLDSEDMQSGAEAQTKIDGYGWRTVARRSY